MAGRGPTSPINQITQMKKSKQFSLRSALLAAAVAVLTLPAPYASAVTEIFNTPGTTMWECPVGVTEIQVECWGGGGAGGVGTKVLNTGGNTSQNGGGGGGGAYARRASVLVTAGNIYAITIPDAAVSGTNGVFAADIVSGVAVTFVGDDNGATVTAAGGVGGRNSYITGQNATNGQAGGAGGSGGSVGDFTFAGGNGSAGNTGATNVSGSGGGSGGDANPGGNAATTASTTTPGDGGVAGGGDGGAGRSGGNTNAGPGAPGATPGGGGGGAHNQGQNSRFGGTGGLGQIAITYFIPPVVKANNTLPLNDPASWVGNMVLGALQVAKWDATFQQQSASLDLGADATWAGLEIADLLFPVTITGANTLTLGAESVDINMSAATQDLTLDCNLALGAANVWDVASTRELAVFGVVSGSGSLTLQGGGTTFLTGANTYDGDTTISAGGTLQLGASDVIPNGSGKGNVAVEGTLDFLGYTDRINALSGNGTVDNTIPNSTARIEVGGNNTSGTFNGILQNSGSSAKLDLEKIGSGTLTLAGENTFTGATTVSGGTLSLSDVSSLSTTASLTLAGGTLLRSTLDGVIINAPVTIGAVGTTATISAPTNTDLSQTPTILTLNQAIAGDGNVTFTSSAPSNTVNTVLLKKQSAYAGSTLLATSGTTASQTFVRLGVDNALPTTTAVTFDGGTGAGTGRRIELDLNGFDQEIAGLTNTARNLRRQMVVNASAADAATLTVNNSSDYEYSGLLGLSSTASVGNFGVTKAGAGKLTLSGTFFNDTTTFNNGYVGDTTVTEGILSIAFPNGNNDASTVTIAARGATLDLTYGGTDTVDKLFIGTTQMAAGVYGPSATNIPQITGSGTLTVLSGTPGYASWAALNGAGANLEDDHDADGVQNGIEYFLGGPNGLTTGPTPLPGVDTTGSLSVTWVKGPGYLGVYGTDFVVETSTTLTGIWDPAILEPDPGATVTITGTDVKFNFPSGMENFARLKVTGF